MCPVRHCLWGPPVTVDRIVLRRPDDRHVHFRDGAILSAVVPHTARQFARAVVMPNLRPPVVAVADARAYRERVLEAAPAGVGFTPLMTVYLTDETDAEELAAGFRAGDLFAAKLYPAGATTNSEFGVTDLARLDPALDRMAEIGMPLLVHGESTDPSVDVFDREAVFLDKALVPLLDRHPTLSVVLEHATTIEAVSLVRERGERLAATITAHHLLINRTHLFQGGLRPHLYCLPIAKRESHRRALLEAVASGHPRFFLGTDTAPHPVSAKESACGCAGCFTAPHALELYAEAFEEAGALDKLEAFASLNGARFHGQPVSEERVLLERTPHRVPDILDVPGGEGIVPFRAGTTLNWTFKGRVDA